MTEQRNSNQNGSSAGDGTSNLVFLLAGGVIGAAVALLFAPKAGADLRTDIADVTRKGYDGALDLTTRVKDQTTSLYGTLRDKAGDLVDAKAGSLSTAADTVNSALDDGKGQIDNVLSLTDQNEGGTGTPRKSTNIV